MAFFSSIEGCQKHVVIGVGDFLYRPVPGMGYVYGVAPVVQEMEDEMSACQILENDATFVGLIQFRKLGQSFDCGRMIVDFIDYLIVLVDNDCRPDTFMNIDAYEFHGLLPLVCLISLQRYQ